ncbi:uncharacterized protein LOC135108348 isoform X2 [Scylla paramamosain]|uniref:uncharacterized protein LOC135108348 isoform X2 n=1 Tax=Scylla paramamosain TaxID=85552 RepID=UPI0030839E5A
MAGIPRVYGVTKPGSETLVLGRTKGLTLDYWLDEGHTAICMTALLHVCKIISRMHYLGISYGNLSVTNILVGVKDSGHLDVSLLGFHRAKRNATEEDIRGDDKQMFNLIRDIIEDIKEESFRNIRDDLRHLFEDIVGVLTLVEIVLLLCGFLNKPPQMDSFPPLPSHDALNVKVDNKRLDGLGWQVGCVAPGGSLTQTSTISSYYPQPPSY